ncbi:Zn-ribbon domain-containing OB-fold protein [Maritimibacter alkaliphilus]|uniref:Zn-ribbon domain-containing OB-fold protein n=1 Tax=Maritimibacter alkaliphilus TaxID=404236 RepID=UPI001C95AE1C|nr:OB-fold domain-containing protein [Maritimibacter alkaliphilus]MBY6092608.1 OB-fold domain-containing protein [Maritimibacter alkaliphilus]
MQSLETHVAQVFASGQIAYQHCPACGASQALARPFCVACLHPAPEWRRAQGTGRVVSVTTMHRAPTPEWKGRLPYTIALVDLSEGLRVMALATPGLAAGDAVRLRPEPLHDLPCFEPMVTE